MSAEVSTEYSMPYIGVYRYKLIAIEQVVGISKTLFCRKLIGWSDSQERRKKH